MNIQDQINEAYQQLDTSLFNFQEISELESTFNTFRQQLSQYQQSPDRIKSQMKILQTLKKDKQKIHDNIAHCLFCIYNQQDITHYFAEMMEITDLMKDHYQSYLSVAAENDKLQPVASASQATQGVLTQIQSQIQSQTSPKMLKGMVAEIVGDIMENIRK